MVDLAPHRIAASQPELKLNKVSPLRSKTVLKSFLPSRKMVNVPEATAFCNIVNVPDVIVLFDLQSQKPCDVQLCEKKMKPKKTSAFCRAQMCTKCSRRPKPKKTNACPMQSPNVHNRGRRNQCISDAKPKCAPTAAEETNAFPMQTQMCTNCSRRNQCILQRPSVQNCSRRNQCVPNVQIFSCARESPGLPRCTLMQRPQVPGANVHKCRKKFNADAMPDAIQCSSSAKSQSFHGAAIFCRTRFTK